MLFLVNKLPDSCNGKEHYQSSIGKKNRKSVKQSEIITYQSKTLENSNIFGINSIIREHRKTLHKLSKTYKTSWKSSPNSSIYSDTKNLKFLKRKKCKHNKTKTCF